MSRALDVYLQNQLAGHLIQDKSGQLTFSYSETWLKHPKAIPLSQSLPLQKASFTRSECRGFFSGVLPEENKREIIAKNLGISAKNDFTMLEQIGGECAGAVTFITAGENLPKHQGRLLTLTPHSLAKILRELPRRPLMAGKEGIRLSLAGAQDKIALHVSDLQFSIPLDGAPSTHILKPAIDRFEGIVFNEAFCMKLARSVGLHPAKVEIGHVENIDYLLIQRYDRNLTPSKSNNHKSLERVHQEDFCQALGVIPENKYQNEGGPSLKQCFALLREISSAPAIDLQRLLDAVIFNFLIGNHDAHAKNFSLLYGNETRLAPLYDLLSTAYYPELSKKMAMKIGSEYESTKVKPKQVAQFSDETGLAKPIVKRRVYELSEIILAKAPELVAEISAAKSVADLIQRRCSKILRDFK